MMKTSAASVKFGVPFWPSKFSNNEVEVGLDSNSKKYSAKNSATFNKIMPKLVPHDDACYLMEFHSDNCDHCEQMEPVLRRLENDLKTKIRRINIFRRREFMGLLEAIGHDECGSLPFYYNRRTGRAICGATTYINLKRWGTGSISHVFNDPPESLQEKMQDTRKKGELGVHGALMDKLMHGSNPNKKDSKNNKNKKTSEKGIKQESVSDKKNDTSK